MILIISDRGDFSTNAVIDWIVAFGSEYIRINPEDRVFIEDITIDDFVLNINNQRIKYSAISSIWYRRGFLNFSAAYEDDSIHTSIKNHLKVEYEAYTDYIYYLLTKKRHIGGKLLTHLNKFMVLSEAKSVGLRIPETFVVKSKDALNSILNKCPKVITKSSNYVFTFKFEEEEYMTYTEEIAPNTLDFFPEEFQLSLVQEKIDKLYEIRVFYLDGETYCMVIFSQNNKNTEVDFRKYDHENPNRNVPYKLPVEIDVKINKLMKKLNLVSGSIDFIVDNNGDHTFLEVNPVGQYGMVAYPCNYPLDKLIAKYLVNNE